MQYATPVDPIFIEMFKKDVGLDWFLTDPNGNNHIVRFNGSLDNPMINGGWKELREFYGGNGLYW